MQTINASNIEQGIPQVVKAVVATAAAAGITVSSTSIESDIREAITAAQPYMKNDNAIAFVVNVPEVAGVKSAVKTETVREAAPAVSRHPAPVRTANAKWNDRCGRWQDSQTGAFIPFA